MARARLERARFHHHRRLAKLARLRWQRQAEKVRRELGMHYAPTCSGKMSDAGTPNTRASFARSSGVGV